MWPDKPSCKIGQTAMLSVRISADFDSEKDECMPLQESGAGDFDGTFASVPLPTAHCLPPTVFHSGTGVESTISRRMASDWSDFFSVER